MSEFAEFSEFSELVTFDQHVPATSGMSPAGDFWLFCSCGWATTQSRYSGAGVEALISFASRAFEQHAEAEAMAHLTREHSSPDERGTE